MIAIVDYDAGNLRSVSKALERLGHPHVITASAHELLRSDGVILPGVGAAGAAMRNLKDRDLVAPLKDVVAAGIPFLGVCLGLQMLMDGSDEDGGVECLGIIPGRVRRLPGGPGLKVPQMGWNAVGFRQRHPRLAGIADGSYFYFVHSYYVEPRDPGSVVGVTEHGLPFASIVARDNVLATQFHPEKSADDGLKIYDSFGRLCAREPAPALAR